MGWFARFLRREKELPADVAAEIEAREDDDGIEEAAIADVLEEEVSEARDRIAGGGRTPPGTS